MNDAAVTLVVTAASSAKDKEKEKEPKDKEEVKKDSPADVEKKAAAAAVLRGIPWWGKKAATEVKGSLRVSFYDLAELPTSHDPATGAQLPPFFFPPTSLAASPSPTPVSSSTTSSSSSSSSSGSSSSSSGASDAVSPAFPFSVTSVPDELRAVASGEELASNMSWNDRKRKREEGKDAWSGRDGDDDNNEAVVRLKIDGKIINENHQLLFEILEGELSTLAKRSMMIGRSADGEKEDGSAADDVANQRYRGICVEALPPYDFRLNGDSFPRLMTLLAMQHFQAISLRWHDLSSTSLSLDEGVDFGSLTALNLRSNNLKVLPKELFMLTNLTFLDLSKNQLPTLHPALSLLTSLRRLEVSGNLLTAIPVEVSALTALEIFKAKKNKLAVLPAQVSRLQHLKIVNVSQNVLVSPSTSAWLGKTENYLESIGFFTELTSLKLRSNRLTALSPALGKLGQLTRCDLSNNQITALPLEIGQLSSLSTLILSQNILESLPPTISNLTRLEVLDVHNNKLTELPKEIGPLCSLLRLNASENKLTSLTSAVGFLSSLLTLELANNQITALPVEVSGLRSLTKLDLSKNQLASLPKQLGDLRCLQVLNVSQNVIRALPSKPFGTLCNLEELHLWGNSLTALPPHMTRLTRLTLLALHRNKIFALDKSFPKLTSLLGLSVANIYISADAHERCQVFVIQEETRLSVFEWAEFSEQAFSDENLQHLLALARSAPHPLLLFALAYFTEFEGMCRRIMAEGALPDVLVACQNSLPRVQFEATRCVANLSSYDDLQRQIVDEGAIDVVLQIIHQSDALPRAKLEAIRCISNLAFHEEHKAQILRFGVDVFADLTKDHNEPHVQRTAYRLLNILGAHEVLHSLHLPHVQARKKQRGIRILSLDGGGTRGIVTIELLKKIEEITGKKTYKLFDLVCGTSTGAILAFAVGIKRYSLMECEAMYKGLCQDVFTIGSSPLTAAPTSNPNALGVSPLLPAQPPVLVSQSTSSSSASASASALLSDTTPAVLSLNVPSAPVVATHPASNSVTVRTQKGKMASTWARLYNYTSLLTSGAFYKSKPLETFLRAHCGEASMIDTTCDTSVKTFLVSSLVSTFPAEVFLFRNYEYPVGVRSRYKGSSRTRLVDALRASTAAPSYFDEVEVTEHGQKNRFQDGGICCNNPTGVAIHEAKALWPDQPVACIVSLGTGKCKKVAAKSGGIQGTISTLIESATSTERVHEVICDLVPPDTYFRLNPSDEAFACELDETDQIKLEEMQKAAQRHIEKNIKLVERLCAHLMAGLDEDDEEDS